MMRTARVIFMLASLAAFGGCAGCSIFQPEGDMTMEVIDETAN